ncbi:MAG TPA: sugar transferase [Acidimicrobiales bacterium]|nr:sugar transferase [Acidimicrobiales bacterium]
MELVAPLAAGSKATNGRLVCAVRLGVVGIDAAAIAAAMAAAFALLPAAPAEAGGSYQVALASLPLWLMAFHRYHLYNSRHVASHRDECCQVVHAVGLGVILTALVAYGLDQIVPRRWLILVFVLASTGVTLERVVVRRWFARLRRRGHFIRRVVVAGTGPEAAALVIMLNEQPHLGYRVVGLLGAGAVDPRVRHLPLFNSTSDVAGEVRNAGAGGVLVATTDVGIETSNRLVRSLTDAGIHVEMSSSLKDIDAERLSVRPLGCFPMMYVEQVKRGGWRPAAKRSFDIVASLLIVVLTLPLMILAALAVKATSPGPVLYRQERVGWHGRRFRIFKLRSMYTDGDERLRSLAVDIPAGPVAKLRKDPRVTPVGRLLRKLSIDEVPQLLDVLRGEMSLVGPRPEQPAEVALWSADLFDRLRVRPGLTGIWQVSGRSAARDTKDRLDLYYVDNWSIGRDIAILLKTVPVVLFSKGAY